MSENVRQIVGGLVSVARGFYARGWLMGTSGNLSAVVEREPLRLAITASGVDKGELKPEQVLIVDENVQVLSGMSSRPGFTSKPNSKSKSASTKKPSDESLLHVRIVKERGAGVVLHTHSIWNTIFSDLHVEHGGVRIRLRNVERSRRCAHTRSFRVVADRRKLPGHGSARERDQQDPKPRQVCAWFSNQTSWTLCLGRQPYRSKTSR